MGAGDHLTLRAVRVYPTETAGSPGLNVGAEAIERGTASQTSLAGDEYGFGEEVVRKLGWEGKRRWIVLTDRIEINPAVLPGKPVICGTRIPVELVIRKLGEGATEADLLDAYPRPTREDIQAALAYAADSPARETILLQPA